MEWWARNLTRTPLPIPGACCSPTLAGDPGQASWFKLVFLQFYLSWLGLHGGQKGDSPHLPPPHTPPCILWPRSQQRSAQGWRGVDAASGC